MTGRLEQALLVTDRLRLVPLAPEHLRFEQELDADPEVMRFLIGRAKTPEEVASRHRVRLEIAARHAGLGSWLGFHRAASPWAGTGGPPENPTGVEDGAFVGWWSLGPPERGDQGPSDRQAELGYRLCRRWWRQGLATEGARALIRYAFDDLGLDRVYAETMAVNVASRATMVAAGMTFERSFHLPFDEPLPGAELGEVGYAVHRTAPAP